LGIRCLTSRVEDSMLNQADGLSILVFGFLLRGADDDRADDLVGEGLTLVVPQRPEPADVTDQRVDGVRDVAHERHARTDRLPGLLAHHRDAERLAADRLTGLATADPAVPDLDADRDGDADDDQEDTDGAEASGRDRGAGLEVVVALHP